MRLLVVLLLLTAGTTISAQQLLFEKTIPEQDVPVNFRLKSEMKSHYISSRYVSQADFLAPQDFFIAINSILIVKSKFIKMHNYPTGSFSYEGRLVGATAGFITFSKYNDRTAGLILLDDGRKFTIDQVAPNIFAISLSDETVFSEREKGADYIEISGESLPDAAVTSICDLSSACPDSSVIDLMVAYTQQAENNWGSAANTVANITQAVTNMNTSMTNSGINNVTFRLVHTTKVTYTESGNFSTDLSRLAGTSDGYMDNVHSLRDQYGADLVSLVIGSPTSSCGIGYLNTNSTSYSSGSAFNVSLYSCVVGNFTMAHECGHNMGLRHDWYVDGSTTPCSHHHGYVNQVAIAQGTSSPSSARWRTIMAYNDQCANGGFNCTRINRWSNPGLIYNGDATGRAIGNTQPSDEAYAYYRMACLVAAFRPEASSCSTPAGLSASGITITQATINWSASAGAISYDVDYKAASSGVWINAETGTTPLSVNLSGLTASTVYDWRVRANCSSGSGTYAQSQFTTQSSPTCNAPTGLTSSNITVSSATVSWSSVNGANNYDIDYKEASSGTWTNAATGTTSFSVNLNGLMASTLYDWRVRANCTDLSGNYSASQFTTSSHSSPCPGPYDISTNGTTAGAATIPLNTDVKGTVSPRNDNDHYKFTITTGGSIIVTLTSLPANYNLAVLNSNGIQIAISQNNGTQSETINITVAAGDYYARVFPKGNASHATSCYTLRVQTGTATDQSVNPKFTLNLFPNPAGDQLNVWVEGVDKKAEIKIYDLMGKLVMQQGSSNTLTQLNISRLSAGFYLVHVNDGKETRSAKFVKK